jgi:Ca2+-binding RTX toxin-like protein
MAGAGSNLIGGGVGNDTIFGGTGTATVFGGVGNDVFAFSNGRGGPSANVTIADFTVGTDRVALVGYGTDVSSVLATASTTGGSTSFVLGDGTRVTLTGIGSTNGIFG